MFKRVVLLAFMLTTMVTFAGCKSIADMASDGDADSINGRIATDGSTSMEKAIGALGEAFSEDNEGVSFTYNPTGSGAGIAAVSDGRCDIGLSSRALKDEEKAKGLTETVLAYDGIAVVINPKNKVSDLTVEQIRDIYTGKIKNWSKLGGEDKAIVLIGREAGSGTRDGFESITNTQELCKYRQELTSAGDVITTVGGNPAAIGYSSIASLKKTVKVIKVAGVEPTEEKIKSGEYVIQRPFMLVTKDDKKLNRTAKAFFDFATSKDAVDILKLAGVVAPN